MALVEVLRTNDPVQLSWARAVLEEAAIPTLVFDAAMSAVEGSLGVLPRRLMVPEDRASYARWLLDQARHALDGSQGDGGGEPG